MSNKKYSKRLIGLMIIAFFTNTIIAQNNNNSAFDDSTKAIAEIRTLNVPFLERVVLYSINKERVLKGCLELTSNTTLKKTAIDQALFMSDFATLEQSNPGERAIAYGGTRNLSELVMKISMSQTKKYTYQQASQLFIDKWKANAKSSNLLFDKSFTIAGFSISIDPIGEKLYASLDLGNTNSIAPILDKSASKYISTKYFGLQLFNAKICSKCNKFNGMNSLAQHLIIEDNVIYFVYDNLKKFKQLIKSPQDGLSIDIINKNQFACNKENILNYQVPNKGILMKPVLFEEFFKSNLEDSKSNKLKVKLTVIPKEIAIDSVEFNLVIINQGSICKNIYKTNIDTKIESKPFKVKANYLKDPSEYYPFDFSKQNVQKKEIDSVNIAAQNPRYLSNIKLYNCLCAYVINGFSYTDGDVEKINGLFEKMKTNKREKLDTIQLLEISYLIQVILSVQTTQNIKDAAMLKLKMIEPFDTDADKIFAIYSFLVKHDEYETALSWIDDLVLSDAIPEEYLFSYISISTLFPERVNSGTFANIMTKAKTINPERFCTLFKPKNYSFQIFENQSVKALICNSCLK